MSATAVTAREHRAPNFWQSTNGKKVVMAVTGAIMFLFIIGHLLGNLLVFAGPARINAYAEFLHFDGALLWIIRTVLIFSVMLHITATVQLALRNKKARPVGYSRKEAINSSYASRTMYWSGPIVLAFIIFHLLISRRGTFTRDAHSLKATFTTTWLRAFRYGGFPPGTSSP